MDAIDKINIILAQKGLTGADLSRAIGVSSGVYSQWNAKVTNPSNKSLFKIAEALGVDVAEILPDNTRDKISFHSRFLELCERKKVSPTKACIEMGLSKALASKWKSSGTRKPSGEVLETMSAYFDLSIDEILHPNKHNVKTDGKSSGEQEAVIRLSDDEFRLLFWYRTQASEKDKAIVKAIIEAEDK